jgi:hypothetical protein
MRKLLGTLTMVILIIAGVGLYRGWFGVATDDQPGQTNVEITVDKEKIRHDAEAASAKARELADKSMSPEAGTAESESTDEAAAE